MNGIRNGDVVAVMMMACLTFAACGGDDANAGGGTVAYETIGDTVVARVSGPPVWGETTVETEEVRIGMLDGAEEYIFGSVTGITVDNERNIYVLDDQAKVVRKYDAQGRHLQNIGRSGAGPGEFQQPHTLDFLPDGRLAVRDFRNARINLYDPAGQPVGTLPIPGGFGTSTPMQVDTLGRIYTSIITERPEGELFRIGYQRFDAEDTSRDTIHNPYAGYSYAPPLVATSPEGNSRSASSVPFSPGVSWTLDRGGNVVWGVGNEYVIHATRDGRPFRIVRTDAEALPVGAGERNAAEENVVRNMRQTQPGWRWSGPGIPDTKPYFKSITVAHDSRIWVQVSQEAVLQPADTTAQRAPDAPRPLDRWVEPIAYDVFESDGQYLARVRMPARFRPLFMRGEYVFGVARDEFDVSYVVRRRVDALAARQPATGR